MVINATTFTASCSGSHCIALHCFSSSKSLSSCGYFHKLQLVGKIVCEWPQPGSAARHLIEEEKIQQIAVFGQKEQLAYNNSKLLFF